MNVTDLFSRDATPLEAPEQLSLLPSSTLPERFRLDDATRRRGLLHVAELRRLLAERQAAREADARPLQLLDRRPTITTHRGADETDAVRSAAPRDDRAA